MFMFVSALMIGLACYFVLRVYLLRQAAGDIEQAKSVRRKDPDQLTVDQYVFFTIRMLYLIGVGVALMNSWAIVFLSNSLSSGKAWILYGLTFGVVVVYAAVLEMLVVQMRRRFLQKSSMEDNM
ncbi:MAG: hypothetical protein Q4P66_09835 [Actinomycetaceae bacterium]|nr:hypothetical protein [Actinomycetaceae bacterium]